MSAQNTASIQTLLEAEREAQQIVERARAYRQQRLKDARTEAGKDVETYKQKKDAEFKEYEKKVSSPQRPQFSSSTALSVRRKRLAFQ